MESHHDEGEGALVIVWWADRDYGHYQHQGIERLEQAAEGQATVAGGLGLLGSVGSLPAQACRRLSGGETYRSKSLA